MIIGRNGATLDSLIMNTGCDIALRPVINGSRIVVIIGNRDKCERAKMMLVDLISSRSNYMSNTTRYGQSGPSGPSGPSDGRMKRKLSKINKIPKGVVGHVIGRKGNTIKEIKQQSQCSIQLNNCGEFYECLLEGTIEEMTTAEDLIDMAIEKAKTFK